MKTPNQIQAMCTAIAYEIAYGEPSQHMRAYLEHELSTLIYVLGDEIPEIWYEISYMKPYLE